MSRRATPRATISLARDVHRTTRARHDGARTTHARQRSAHIAHATPVSVGARTEKLAEITRGLSGGEMVVTYGAYGVTDSARVVPLTEERR